MTMDTLPLPEPGVLIRIGRAKRMHRARVAIRDMRVIVRTQCGLDRDTTDAGFTETWGVPTCPDCIAADPL